jgi:4-alpha-glucanotransferase
VRFADFLTAAGQGYWQMLPVGPTGYGNSPYSALSAFAGNPALVSVDHLVEEGLIAADERHLGRDELMRRAHGRFRAAGGEASPAYEAFCAREREWLDEYALYRVLKRAHGEVQWTRWAPEYRDRRPAALAAARERLADDCAAVRFEQFRFDEDWNRLRQECAARGIALVGDIPIFVAHDSADVWQHRELFRLDAAGEPEVVAGVPPDYFSATGQRWGNPLYRWKRLRRTGYHWWIERLRSTLSRFDLVRLDHFIGFQRYWEIPAGEPDAVKGRWMKGPGAHFLRHARRALGRLPFIAEDLGAVTPAVTALRRRFGLPGLRILQFAFGTDPQGPSFLPHNYERRTVAYTGTHDNDTTVGWFHDPGGPGSPRSAAQAEAERQATLRYLGADDDQAIEWRMIRALYQSVAALVVVPLQDVLGLGSEARMNRPGLAHGNWTWRLEEASLTPALAARLRGLAETYERLPHQRLAAAVQPWQPSAAAQGGAR